MEAFVTVSASFWIDLDDVKCYNIETGEMTKDLPDNIKLDVLDGVNDIWTISSFNDLVINSKVKDYEIIDVEVED